MTSNNGTSTDLISGIENSTVVVLGLIFGLIFGIFIFCAVFWLASCGCIKPYCKELDEVAATPTERRPAENEEMLEIVRY